VSKYQAQQSGRPYAEVRGYLRREIELPAVAAEVLTPTSAPLASYGLDSSGLWRHIGETVVWAYDEALAALPLVYCRASLNPDDRFEIYWTGCTATLLTLPLARQRAVLAIADNTTAPPTEVAGARYLLDTAVGGVHAEWDTGVADDIVEFNGSVWVPSRPGHRWIVNVTATGADWSYSVESPVEWSVVV
jgi:hypothetical protein